MTEEKKIWNQENFDQTMKQSKNELEELKTQLEQVMVKFGLRALRTYQAARNEPLRPTEVASLVKYELDSAIIDLSAPKSLERSCELYISESENTQTCSSSKIFDPHATAQPLHDTEASGSLPVL